MKISGMKDSLAVALVSDVFFSDDARDRLVDRLEEAKRQGAELALLPEICLLPWSPATREPRASDAEPPGGPRHQLLAAAARAAGIAALGGTIVASPPGRPPHRFNEAILVDARGELVGSYRKVHLPQEPGFWEACHYEPGTEPPRVLSALGFPVGIQICSDSNRPVLTHALAAEGACAVLAPRATERDTWESWKLVFRANALTASVYVLSVNRPAPEQGVPLGGPSLAVAPDGSVLLETTEPVATVRLERSAVERARKDYPGYLAVPAELYREAWARCASRT